MSSIHFLLLVIGLSGHRFVGANTELSDASGTLEIGPGLSMLTMPDYIGSDEEQTLALPFPYVKYSGEHWQVDRNLINRSLFAAKQWRLDLSFSGSLPVNSEENAARAGMRDLMPTIEVGPWLQYRFAENKQHYWRTDVAIRKAAASDLSDYQNAGWTAQAQLFAHIQWQQRNSLWQWENSLSALWGDARQHQYFYGVNDMEQTPNRALYHAQAGYSGCRLSSGLTRRQGPWWAAVFVRYFNLNDARFNDSPLLKAEENWVAGIAFAWVMEKH